eukprot:jgi/Mesvir1/11090/Mv02463-RA.2
MPKTRPPAAPPTYVDRTVRNISPLDLLAGRRAEQMSGAPVNPSPPASTALARGAAVDASPLAASRRKVLLLGPVALGVPDPADQRDQVVACTGSQQGGGETPSHPCTSSACARASGSGGHSWVGAGSAPRQDAWGQAAASAVGPTPSSLPYGAAEGDWTEGEDSEAEFCWPGGEAAGVHGAARGIREEHGRGRKGRVGRSGGRGNETGASGGDLDDDDISAEEEGNYNDVSGGEGVDLWDALALDQVGDLVRRSRRAVQQAAQRHYHPSPIPSDIPSPYEARHLQQTNPRPSSARHLARSQRPLSAYSHAYAAHLAASRGSSPGRDDGRPVPPCPTLNLDFLTNPGVSRRPASARPASGVTAGMSPSRAHPPVSPRQLSARSAGPGLARRLQSAHTTRPDSSSSPHGWGWQQGFPRRAFSARQPSVRSATYGADAGGVGGYYHRTFGPSGGAGWGRSFPSTPGCLSVSGVGLCGDTQPRENANNGATSSASNRIHSTCQPGRALSSGPSDGSQLELEGADRCHIRLEGADCCHVRLVHHSSEAAPRSDLAVALEGAAAISNAPVDATADSAAPVGAADMTYVSSHGGVAPGECAPGSAGNLTADVPGASDLAGIGVGLRRPYHTAASLAARQDKSKRASLASVMLGYRPQFSLLFQNMAGVSADGLRWHDGSGEGGVPGPPLPLAEYEAVLPDATGSKLVAVIDVPTTIHVRQVASPATRGLCRPAALEDVVAYMRAGPGALMFTRRAPRWVHHADNGGEGSPNSSPEAGQKGTDGGHDGDEKEEEEEEDEDDDVDPSTLALISFTARLSGRYTLGVLVRGSAARNSPLQVEVLKAVTVPASCYARGAGLRRALAGESARFVILAVDQLGNKRLSGGDRFQLVFSGPAPVDTTRIVDGANGRYTVTYNAPAAVGLYSLAILLDGVNIRGSPFGILVSPGDVEAANSIISSLGTARDGGSVAGDKLFLHIHTRDKCGNTVNSDSLLLHCLLVLVPKPDAEPAWAPLGGASTSAGNTSAPSTPRETGDVPEGVEVVLKPLGGGHYEGSYTIYKAGEYRLLLNGKTCTLMQSLVVYPAPACASTSSVRWDRVPEAVRAGQNVHLAVILRDRYGNACLSGDADDAAAASLQIQVDGPTAVHPERLTRSRLARRQQRYDVGDSGAPPIESLWWWTAVRAGLYHTHVFVNGEPVLGGPHTTAVTAGPLHVPSCTVRGGVSSLPDLMVAKCAWLWVEPRDCYGNLIMRDPDVPKVGQDATQKLANSLQVVLMMGPCAPEAHIFDAHDMPALMDSLDPPPPEVLELVAEEAARVKSKKGRKGGDRGDSSPGKVEVGAGASKNKAITRGVAQGPASARGLKRSASKGKSSAAGDAEARGVESLLRADVTLWSSVAVSLAFPLAGSYILDMVLDDEYRDSIAGCPFTVAVAGPSVEGAEDSEEALLASAAAAAMPVISAADISWVAGRKNVGPVAVRQKKQKGEEAPSTEEQGGPGRLGGRPGGKPGAGTPSQGPPHPRKGQESPRKNSPASDAPFPPYPFLPAEAGCRFKACLVLLSSEGIHDTVAPPGVRAALTRLALGAVQSAGSSDTGAKCEVPASGDVASSHIVGTRDAAVREEALASCQVTGDSDAASGVASSAHTCHPPSADAAGTVKEATGATCADTSHRTRLWAEATVEAPGLGLVLLGGRPTKVGWYGCQIYVGRAMREGSEGAAAGPLGGLAGEGTGEGGPAGGEGGSGEGGRGPSIKAAAEGMMRPGAELASNYNTPSATAGSTVAVKGETSLAGFHESMPITGVSAAACKSKSTDGGLSTSLAVSNAVSVGEPGDHGDEPREGGGGGGARVQPEEGVRWELLEDAVPLLVLVQPGPLSLAHSHLSGPGLGPDLVAGDSHIRILPRDDCGNQLTGPALADAVDSLRAFILADMRPPGRAREASQDSNMSTSLYAVSDISTFGRVDASPARESGRAVDGLALLPSPRGQDEGARSIRASTMLAAILAGSLAKGGGGVRLAEARSSSVSGPSPYTPATCRLDEDGRGIVVDYCLTRVGAYVLEIKCEGGARPPHALQWRLQVLPGPIHVPSCTLDDDDNAATLRATAGVPSDITVTLRDRFGNERPDAGAALWVSLRRKHGEDTREPGASPGGLHVPAVPGPIESSETNPPDSPSLRDAAAEGQVAPVAWPGPWDPAAAGVGEEVHELGQGRYRAAFVRQRAGRYQLRVLCREDSLGQARGGETCEAIAVMSTPARVGTPPVTAASAASEAKGGAFAHAPTEAASLSSIDQRPLSSSPSLASLMAPPSLTASPASSHSSPAASLGAYPGTPQPASHVAADGRGNGAAGGARGTDTGVVMWELIEQREVVVVPGAPDCCESYAAWEGMADSAHAALRPSLMRRRFKLLVAVRDAFGNPCRNLVAERRLLVLLLPADTREDDSNSAANNKGSTRDTASLTVSATQDSAAPPPDQGMLALPTAHELSTAKELVCVTEGEAPPWDLEPDLQDAPGAAPAFALAGAGQGSGTARSLSGACASGGLGNYIVSCARADLQACRGVAVLVDGRHVRNSPLRPPPVAVRADEGDQLALRLEHAHGIVTDAMRKGAFAWDPDSAAVWEARLRMPASLDDLEAAQLAQLEDHMGSTGDDPSTWQGPGGQAQGPGSPAGPAPPAHLPGGSERAASDLRAVRIARLNALARYLHRKRETLLTVQVVNALQQVSKPLHTDTGASSGLCARRRMLGVDKRQDQKMVGGHADRHKLSLPPGWENRVKSAAENKQQRLVELRRRKLRQPEASYTE